MSASCPPFSYGCSSDFGSTARSGFGPDILPPGAAVVEQPRQGARTTFRCPGRTLPERAESGWNGWACAGARPGVSYPVCFSLMFLSSCVRGFRQLAGSRPLRRLGEPHMTVRSHALHRLLRHTLAAPLAGLGLLTVVAAAHAQVRWTIDPKTSIAWWQMSPNLNHLWATTCPGDPSWRPGEGRSSGWNINPKLKLPRTGYANVDDTVHVPLFPRHD